MPGHAGFAYTYRWVRVDGVTETDITRATEAKTYTLVTADEGKTIKVKVGFTDDADNAEGPLTSDGVGPVKAMNAARGAPAISGFSRVGDVVTASKGTIADPDGVTKADNGDADYAYTYQWVRVDGMMETDIDGATSRDLHARRLRTWARSIKVRALLQGRRGQRRGDRDQRVRRFRKEESVRAPTSVLQAAVCNAPDISGERELWSGDGHGRAYRQFCNTRLPCLQRTRSRPVGILQSFK